MYLSIITGISILLQFTAAALAVRLIRMTQNRLAWLLISIALILMTIRRFLPFSHAVSGRYDLVDPYNEVTAVIISVLLMVGMLKIAPIFTETHQANAARQQAEKSLRESEINLWLAHEAADIGVWKNDLQTGVVYFDERARQHYGFPTLQTTLAEVIARMHPEDAARLQAEISAATMPGSEGRVQTEYRVLDPGGQVRWLSIYGAVVFDGAGAERRAVNGFGTSQDITERKIAQQQLEALNRDLRQAYDETIEGWSHALDLRDHETVGHSRRVTDLTIQLAREMGFCEEALVHIRWGALLHDIGKVGVPDQILLKPGDLNDREWEIMRQHPQYAFRLLSPISFLKSALDIPYCHHEKWDGSGYPRRLKGEDIPLAARIFAVVDVWDALRSDRSYRAGWSKEEALRYLQQESGRHFDPQIVERFTRFVEGGE